MTCLPPLDAEWLAADGLGGFASGTVSGIRTRRYHALLLCATQPPAGRMVLVNGFDAWLDTPAGRHPLTSQRYKPDVVSPAGATLLSAFEPQPWPRWTYRFPNGVELTQELIVPHGASAAILGWHLNTALPAARLVMRPFFSGRDFHHTHCENPVFRFDPERGEDGTLTWRMYEGVPGVVIKGGQYRHDPHWYRGFLYTEELARGLDSEEDLASPGEFIVDLTSGCAEIALAAAGHEEALSSGFSVHKAEAARRAASFASPAHLAADSYVVRRGGGHTIIAGYPWFGDWGRDTFISMRGLCLATGRLDLACEILLQWAGAVSEGMLPNRFPDRGDVVEYNSVDASLWYVIAAQEYLEQARPEPGVTETLKNAMLAILHGYCQGTRYGIRMDADGLLACGEPGSQLTWMDARVNGVPMTPRAGKPVEIQALWINAMTVGAVFEEHWQVPLSEARQSFTRRFWNEKNGMLHDVVDVNHEAGVNDSSIRPNQVLAIGGLPWALLDGARARSILEGVEKHLLTPAGLRTLAPGSQGYIAHYQGAASLRDAAYHQGTVWPWLMGPFAEAWMRVHGAAGVRERFVAPLRELTNRSGLGHLPEIADPEPPFTSRGCPFQAWSLGELLRIEHKLDPLP